MPKTAPLRFLSREDLIYSPIKALQNSQPDSKRSSKEDEHAASSDTMTITTSDRPSSTFPQSENEREKYRTKAGKKITQYQWDVYDFILGIPKGKVTTYKVVAQQVGGSARSAGNALRVNPFAPYIPCHRIIASNFFIGGFFGEWAKRHKPQASTNAPPPAMGDQVEINKKIALLKQEGVSIDARGFLVGGESMIWRPSEDPVSD